VFTILFGAEIHKGERLVLLENMIEGVVDIDDVIVEEEHVEHLSGDSFVEVPNVETCGLLLLHCVCFLLRNFLFE